MLAEAGAENWAILFVDEPPYGRLINEEDRHCVSRI